MRHSKVFITDDGHVACQGPTLMTGYVGDEEKTREVLHDGTVVMADNGEIDSEGMLHLTGRDDDVINIGGYKIAPSEVEDAAFSFPSVKDCICICGNHPVLGNILKLLVVLDEGVVLDKRALARFIADRLESYKVPQAFEQVTAVQRTYNGKIDRKYYRLR